MQLTRRAQDDYERLTSSVVVQSCGGDRRVQTDNGDVDGDPRDMSFDKQQHTTCVRHRTRQRNGFTVMPAKHCSVQPANGLQEHIVDKIAASQSASRDHSSQL